MEKMQRINNKKGFSLLEIAIVVLIIAVLAAIMLPGMVSAMNNGNVTSSIQSIVLCKPHQVSIMQPMAGHILAVRLAVFLWLIYQLKDFCQLRLPGTIHSVELSPWPLTLTGNQWIFL